MTLICRGPITHILSFSVSLKTMTATSATLRATITIPTLATSACDLLSSHPHASLSRSPVRNTKTSRSPTTSMRSGSVKCSVLCTLFLASKTEAEPRACGVLASHQPRPGQSKRLFWPKQPNTIHSRGPTRERPRPRPVSAKAVANADMRNPTLLTQLRLGPHAQPQYSGFGFWPYQNTCSSC